MLIILQKYIAQNSNFSRRKAENLILKKKVMVNHKIAEPGQKVNPQTDLVQVNDKRITIIENRETVVYAFNKPKGITSTTRKFSNEQNVLQYFPKKQNLIIAGRLDKESRGLMILTNDGNLADSIMHPSQKSEKEYIVRINKPIDALSLMRLRKGIKYQGIEYKTISVKEIEKKKLRIVLGSGKKRHIRMMLRACGYNVSDLFRKRINQLDIGQLKSGNNKKLSENEIRKLRTVS